jgi:hypothetical protein
MATSSSEPVNVPASSTAAVPAPKTVTYAGSVQQVDEAQAQALVAQDPALQGFAGFIFRPGKEAAAKANADKSASQYATSQGRGLQHDITTQPGPDTGGHNYLAYQQTDLHQMVNTNADPANLNLQGQTFNDIGNDFADMTSDLDKATSTAAVSWQGEAAEGGAAFTTGMSSWHGSTAQGAQYAGTQLYEQSQALDQARTNMPPPMTAPTTADLQQALLSFNPLDPSSLGTVQNLANQATAANANHQVMARVAQQYDSQLGTSATLPEFNAPTQFNPNPPAPTGSGAGGSGSGSSGAGSRPPVVRSGNGSSAGVPGANSTSSHGGPSSSGLSSPPQVTGGQGSQPSGKSSGTTTTQGTGSGTTPPLTGGQPGGSPAPNTGGIAGLGDNSTSGGGMPVVGGFSGGNFGGSGGSAAGGGAGWRPTGSGGGNAGGESSGQPGSRSGANPGAAAAAEEAEAEGSMTGARGASGTGMGGMGAGRGGKGGEDREHKRAPFLLESDPESIFGTDEKTIPRVIGE